MSLHECVDLIQSALLDGYAFFSRGITTAGKPPPTQSDIVVVLNSISDLRATNNLNELVSVLSRTKIYATAAALSVEPLLYSQSQDAGASLQQTFVKVRCAAMEAVGEIASMHAGVAQASASLASVAFLEALLAQVAAPASFETVRLSTAQCLFSLCATVPQPLPAGLLQAIVQCAVLEPSPVVRSVLLCVLREAAIPANRPALQQEAGTFAKLLEVDDSSDVRTLAAELLTAVLSAEVASQPRDFITAIRNQLGNFTPADTSADERNATAILVTTLCMANPNVVFPEICRQHLDRALLHAGLQTLSFQILATLRTVLDRCPAELRLGQQLLSNFDSFSGLLKLILDCHGNQDSSLGADTQTAGIEAATIVALLLAQSPGHRQHVKRELHAFPMWAGALRESLLHFLNLATLDFFSDLTMVDFSNTPLSSLEGVEWNDQERPHRQSIQRIFTSQEARFHEGAMLPPPRLPPPSSLSDSALRRQNKIAFVVLSYAVHATLGEDAPPTPSLAATGAYGNASPRAGLAQAAAPPLESTFGATGHDGTPVPRFPTPSSARRSQAATIQRDTLTAQEKQEMAFAYDRFDSSFKLTLTFAKYYAQASVKPAVYEPTPDGFVVRQAQLKNPWGPLVKKPQVKSWHVRDVKEGDLFYFAIPFNDLNQKSVEIVLERARRHIAFLKKAFITTPQTARGRRWLLYDMLHHVMPNVIELLKTVHGLLGNYGDENVRFPVFLFREKEMHLGERAIHSGNLSEIVDQVNFYFSQHPAALFGTPDDAAAVAHLEERLRELAMQSDAAGMHPDSEDGGGHGGISSDSELDD